MKTSNYIIISFFVFLFGAIFVLFLTSKYHKSEVPQWKIGEKPLDDFSVVVAEPGARFQVKIGETTKLQINYKSPDTLCYPKSYVRNDTLYMFPYEGKIQSKKMEKGPVLRYNNVTIYTKQIRSIVGKEHSDIELFELTADTLKIQANECRIVCNYQKPEKPKGLFDMKATEGAFVEVTKLNVRNVKLELNKSHLNLQNTTIQTLAGSLSNHSRLTSYRTIQNLNLLTDSTCTYYLEKKIYLIVTTQDGKKVERDISETYLGL